MNKKIKDGWYIEMPGEKSSNSPEGTTRLIIDNHTVASWLFNKMEITERGGYRFYLKGGETALLSSTVNPELEIKYEEEE